MRHSRSHQRLLSDGSELPPNRQSTSTRSRTFQHTPEASRVVALTAATPVICASHISPPFWAGMQLQASHCLYVKPVQSRGLFCFRRLWKCAKCSEAVTRVLRTACSLETACQAGVVY